MKLIKNLALAAVLAIGGLSAQAADETTTRAAALTGKVVFGSGGMEGRYLILESWSSTGDYPINTMLKHDGEVWVASTTKPSVGDEPGTATSWQMVTGTGEGRTQEEIEDFVGGMVDGNTETNITVTYQDSDGTLDFVVTSGGGQGLTAVSSDATLSGDGTSTSPLGIADDGVTTAKLDDDAVTAGKLATSGAPSDQDLLTWNASNSVMVWRADTHLQVPLILPDPPLQSFIRSNQIARFNNRIVWNASSSDISGINTGSVPAHLRAGLLTFIPSHLGTITGSQAISNMREGDTFIADGVRYVALADRTASFERDDIDDLLAAGTIGRDASVTANPAVSNPTRMRTIEVGDVGYRVESIVYPADGSASLPTATSADWDSAAARSKILGYLDNKLWTVTRGLTAGHAASGTWTAVANNTTFNADGENYRWRGFHSNRPSNPQEFDFYWDTDDDFLHIRIHTGGVGFWVRQNQYNFLQRAMNLVIGLPYNYFTTQEDALAHIHQNGQRAVYLDSNGNRVLATVSSFSAAAGSQYTYTWTAIFQDVVANPVADVDSGQLLKLGIGGRIFDAAPVRLPVAGDLVAPTADDYDATYRESKYLGWDGEMLEEVERRLLDVHSADAAFALVADGTNFGPFDGTTYRYRGAFSSQIQVSSPQTNDFYFDTGYLELYLCSDLGGSSCVFGNTAHSGLTSRLVQNINYVAHERTYTAALGIVSANDQTLAIDKAPWPAKGEILVTGTEGTLVPLGTQVQTTGNVVFRTYEGGTIPAAGTLTLDARAVVGGSAGNIADDTVLTAVTTIAGVTGITAEGAFTGGDDTTSGWGLYTVSDYQAPDAGHYEYDWTPFLNANPDVPPTAGQLYELHFNGQVYDTAPLRLPVDGQITLPSSSDWNEQYGRSRHVWFDGRHLFRVIKIRNTVTTNPSATFTEVPEYTTLNVATTSTNFRWRRTHWQDNLVSNPQQWDLYARRPDFRLRYYDGSTWRDLALTGSFNGHPYRGWWDDEDDALDHVSANDQYVGYGFSLYQVSEYDDGVDVSYTYDFENMLPEGVVLDPSDASLLDHLHEREPRDVDVTFAPLETDGHYRGWSTIGPGNGAISEAPPSDSDILEIGFVDPNYSFTSFFGLDSGFLGHLTLVVNEGPNENQYEGAKLRFKDVEFTFHEVPYDNNNNRARYLSNTFVRLADQPARNAQGAFNVENIHTEDIALGGTPWLWHTMRASPSGSDEPALTASDVKVFVPTTGRGVQVGDMDSESATDGQYPAATGTDGGVEWRSLPSSTGGSTIEVATVAWNGTTNTVLATVNRNPEAGDIVNFQMPNIGTSTTNTVRFQTTAGGVLSASRFLRDQNGRNLSSSDFTQGATYNVQRSGADSRLVTTIVKAFADAGQSVKVGLGDISPTGSIDGQVLTSTGPNSDPAWEAASATVTNDGTLSGDGSSDDPIGVADGGIGSTQLAVNSVSSTHVVNNSLTQADLGADSVGPSEISTSGSTDGQVLTSTGPNSDPAWETPTTGSGGLTSVTSDSTLTGDGTSGTPLGIADGGVSHAKFADDVGGHNHMQTDGENVIWNSATNTITVPIPSRAPDIGDTVTFVAPNVGTSTTNELNMIVRVDGTDGASHELHDIHRARMSSSEITGGDLYVVMRVDDDVYELTDPIIKNFADRSQDVKIVLDDLETTNLNNLNFRPVQWDGTDFRVGTLAQNTLANSVSERLLPAGGDDEECLRKSADSNYDVEWSACGTGGGGLSSVTITSPGALEGNGTSGSPLDVRDSGITTTHIQNNTVTGFDVQDGTLLGADLANRTVTPAKVNPSGSTDGQVLTSTGPSSDPQWETLPTTSGGEGLSAVNSDSSLHGDGTSGSPLGVADNGVGHDQIANDSISRDKMRNDSVGTSEILDSSITSVDIANATIAALDIANDAVTLGKISTTGSTDGQVLMSTGPTSDPTWGSVTRSGVGTQYIDSANHLSFGNSVDVVIATGQGYVQNVGDIIEFHWFGTIDSAHYSRDVTIRFSTGGTSVPVFWRIDDASTEMHGEDVLPDWSYQLIRRSARWDLINMVPPTPGHWSKSVSGDVATGRVLTTDGDGGYTWETPVTPPDSLGGIIDGGDISTNELIGNDGWDTFSSTGVTTNTPAVGPSYTFSKAGVYRIEWIKNSNIQMCFHKHTSAPTTLLQALDNNLFATQTTMEGRRFESFAAGDTVWFRNCTSATTDGDLTISIIGH